MIMGNVEVGQQRREAHKGGSYRSYCSSNWGWRPQGSWETLARGCPSWKGAQEASSPGHFLPPTAQHFQP